MELKIKNELEVTFRPYEVIQRDSLWMPDKQIHGYRFKFRAESWYQYRFIQDKAKGSLATVKDNARDYFVQSVDLLNEDVRDDKLRHAEFDIEIAEYDEKPNFKVLEVEGIAMSVLRYASRIDEKSMVHRFLLDLNQEKFEKLAEFLQVHRKSTLSIRRVDVDDEPLEGHVSDGNPWSRTEERGGRYLRVLNFVMVRKASQDRRSRSHIRVNNLERKVANLSFKLEYLLKRMKTSLNEEDLRILSSPKPPAGIPNKSIVAFWTDLDRTEDASRYFGDDE